MTVVYQVESIRRIDVDGEVYVNVNDLSNLCKVLAELADPKLKEVVEVFEYSVLLNL